ncbi:exodeoxyribonuclease V subunit alpha [Isoptericola halotolerans]|uniref:exodeoxyribonuclease V subunit alpha n=1 Tax=Isoptericola halotolerans TaxID=300560 RepID=UPI00388DF641
MTTETTVGGDVRLAVGATGLLGDLNAAGIVASTDVHVATRLGRLTGETDERVLLAVALAVRALRGGSVCVRLDDATELAALARPEDDGATARPATSDAGPAAADTVSAAGEAGPAVPPWPEHDAWVAAIETSPLVAAGVDGPAARPVRWVGGRLYLDRYWRDELTVRDRIDERVRAEPFDVPAERLATALARLFPSGGDTRQRLAAAHAARRRVTVLTGGPGTGKTTTVARLLAVVHDVAGTGSGAGSDVDLGTEARPLRVALAAPTGKAAARLQEAVREVVSGLGPDDRERTGAPVATTVHRLLGYRSATRFRHDAAHHLPHDVVVVDETSMVPLSLMARLLEALRPDARLVLVGDPDQLASVEAGAVLGDLVHRPSIDGAPAVETVRTVTASATPALDGTGDVPLTGAEPDRLRNGVVGLATVYRQQEHSAILPLASAVRAGDADAALAVLRAGTGGVELVEADTDRLTEDDVHGVHADAVEAGRLLVAAARDGDPRRALEALSRHRVMVAHRRGPVGVARWAGQVEAWVEEATGADRPSASGPWVAGRPLLVTSNDAEVGLYNGDTGVVVADGDGVVAAFGDPRDPLRVRTHRLPPVETVHAMTVHRAQGSQFRRVSLVLPPPTSPLLTRELLYTAVTRASEHVRVLGTADAVRAAVVRPVRRASGLRDPLPS